ncbi:MAG: hypothetical protein QME12_02790 [Nanoarchaeota archaeon]|nr:hypothetical protein [Nanoarchaeota archaeon]
MKQTTLALIASLAAGIGFAAGSGAHETKAEIATLADRVSYGTIARKLNQGN